MRLRYGLDFPAAHLSSPMQVVSPSVLCRGVARRDTRLPLSPHCNPSGAPSQDSLGDFHHSQTVSYPLLQTGFQGNRRCVPGRGHDALALPSTLPTQGRLLCTQRSRHEGRVAPRCRFAICFVHRSLTTKGVRLCTTAGLHDRRVGSSMPLEGALRPQAR